MPARHGRSCMREKKLDEREAAVAAQEKIPRRERGGACRQEDRLNARERAADPEPEQAEAPEPTVSPLKGQGSETDG